MDAGLSLKPVVAATTEHDRTISGAPAKPAAPTELPKAKAVSASGAASHAGNDSRPTKAYIDVDPQTRDVIFRVVNNTTEQVVDQIPDQTILNARAYFREMARKEAEAHAAEAAAAPRTDVTA